MPANYSVGDLLAGPPGVFPGVFDPQAGELLGVSIRRWAHVVEFGVLGLFVAVAACRMLCPRLARAAGVSLAICLACSLFDQCHKLFVPGRHFEGADLVMDAVGYMLTILVVCLLAEFQQGANLGRDAQAALAH